MNWTRCLTEHHADPRDIVRQGDASCIHLIRAMGRHIGRKHRMTPGFQKRCHPVPTPAAMKGTVNENKYCHIMRLREHDKEVTQLVKR